jgi:hypothetical protein
MYICKNFIIEEFVSSKIYNELKNDSWKLLDERILITVDELRLYIGKKITINNWKWGGTFSQRGYRDLSIGSKYSQHRFGRAIDFDVNSYSSEEIRKIIISKQELFPFVTAIEKNTNWVHIDCRYLYRSNGILLFNP